MGGDEVTLEPPPSGRCSILLTFEKINELGHCEIQLKTLRLKYGQYPTAVLS